MNASMDHVQDRLLDLAYGELGSDEARAVEAHVAACASCRASLDEIRGVRKVMSSLPTPAAPDAGLESLLAYAEQAARRAQAAPPKRKWWRTLTLSLAGVAATFLFGFVALEVLKAPELQQSPAEQVFADRAKAEGGGEVVFVEAPPEASAPAGDLAAAQSAPPVVRERSFAGAPPPEPAPMPKKAVAQKSMKASDEDLGGRALAANELKRDQSEYSGKAPATKEPPERDEVAAAALADEGSAGGLASSAGLGDVEATAQRPSTVPLLKKDAQRMAQSMPAPAAARAPSASSDAVRAEAASEESEARDRRAAVAERTYSDARALSERAKDARRAGDRVLEAAYLRQALNTGVHDDALVSDLLVRLCEAELAVGNAARGRTACERVVREYPRSRAAERAAAVLAPEAAKDAKPAAIGH